MLHEAIELLPSLSPRTLPHTGNQHVLEAIGTLGPDAAAVALNVGEAVFEAIKLLELGRGVIAGTLIEMRSDISTLRQLYPDLACQFLSLRDQLSSVSIAPTAAVDPVNASAEASSAQFLDTAHKTLLDSGAENIPSWELQSKRRREAEVKFDELLARIRSKPEFSEFLLPPGEDSLKAAAKSGPIIVVNVSYHRCDAFLIESHQVRLLPLSELGLTLAGVEERVRSLRSGHSHASSIAMSTTLKWLWDTIARPCLDALGFDKPIPDSAQPESWPHVWWIPTGLLSHLPLHAAGYHDSPSRDNTVLDRVISSYALSIKSLLFCRQQTATRTKTTPPPPSALLVSMPSTPGLSRNSNLRFARKEADLVRTHLPNLHLSPVVPDPEPIKETILRHLQSCTVFHFASHGRLDPRDPSRSGILLRDWQDNPFTVNDLRDRTFQDNSPLLAFLSACSTGANNTLDGLNNEGIHLVSTFQLAGFRHVVGTLWEVLDESCVVVADVFYGTLAKEGMGVWRGACIGRFES